MRANREMGLKERLLEAQLADYDARVQGKGAYARTGRSGGSGEGSGVASNDWEAYKANAGLRVVPQQQTVGVSPEAEAVKQALLERPEAPTAKELPSLLEATNDRLGSINPQYGAALQAINGLTNQHDQLIKSGGLVNPEVATLQTALDDIRKQTVVPNASTITPEEILKLGPEELKVRADTLGSSTKYLENKIAELSNKAYASPDVVAKRQQSAALAPIVSQEKEKALQTLNEANEAISLIRKDVNSQNDIASKDFTTRMKAFNEASKEAAAPTSKQNVADITNAVGSGIPLNSDKFPDLSTMNLSDLQKYRSRFRESYLETLNSPLTTSPEFIEQYRQEAITNLEAKAAAYGRTPNRREIGAMEQSIGPGAAKAWQAQQKTRFDLYEKEIDDWIDVKSGGSEKDKTSALLTSIREGNPSKHHSALTSKITGFESLADAFSPGSAGTNKAEQSINNLYTYANEKGIKLPKMQEGITKALQTLINEEPISPDWDVNLFNDTLVKYLIQEEALPKGLNVTELKDLLTAESKLGIY